jgi:hypothetical protein
MSCPTFLGGGGRPKRKIAAWQSEDCTGHLKICSAAIEGSRRPIEKLPNRKIVTQQSEDCTGQLKNHGMAINGLHWPKEKLQCDNQRDAPAKRKIAVWQSTDCASQKKICSTAIRVSRRHLQKKIAAWQSGYCTSLFKKLWHLNRWITPAERKEAVQRREAAQHLRELRRSR